MSNYQPHRFPYLWRLADGYPAKGIENHGCKVFGTFICGGGSSMGYKLAGFHHLGGVELDPKVAKVYDLNHHPEYLYNMDIRDFNQLEDLPAELYNLDILDGSPPCSTFSTAGSRDKAWGKEKRFAEGQKLQTLDDLVFVYCDTILKLRPKCFILENVKGLILGNARSYSKRIVQYLTQNGYMVQVFCLNAATMGVPQTRERVFFIGHRSEYKLPKLELQFNEEPIPFIVTKPYWNDEDNANCSIVGYSLDKLWSEINIGCNHPKHFSLSKPSLNSPCPTITATSSVNSAYSVVHPVQKRKLNNKEISILTTFPIDYKIELPMRMSWLCGMSVPPVMTAQISYQIYKQWLSKIKQL